MKFMEKMDWTFAKESPTTHVHGLHPYPARMHPPVARKAIELFARKSGSKIPLVLDPFCGSGGVLVEARLQGCNSVGIDINPLAKLLAEVKSNPIDPLHLQEIWREVREDIHNAKSEIRFKKLIESVKKYNFSLYCKETLASFIENKKENPRVEGVVKILQNGISSLGFFLPELDTNFLYWFKPQTILELSLIKHKIDKIEDEEIRKFFYVCFSKLVREVSGTRKGEFKLYRMPLAKWVKFLPNSFQEFEKIVETNIAKMGEYYELCKQKKVFDVFSNVFLADTRKILTDKFPKEGKELLLGNVDLIVTSPPYGDSRTTVAYGQFSRYSLLWLGFSKEETLEIDKMSLGGNRKNSKSTELHSQTLRKIIQKVEKKSKSRARDIKLFFIDLFECLKSLSHVMKVGGHACFVLGNRTVKNVKIPTDRILAELGEDVGFKHLTTFERKIVTKRIPWRSSPSNVPGKTVETISKESIVILKRK